MAKPILTAERLREVLDYEPSTGIFTYRLPRQSIKVGDVAGKPNDRGYTLLCIDGRTYRAHRLAWLHTYGFWPSHFIDHINGIPSDNRIENLRDVSPRENSQNQREASRTNKTGLLGVSIDSKSSRYRAQIRVSGKKVWLGLFDSKEDAHQAYLKAKRLYHSGGTI